MTKNTTLLTAGAVFAIAMPSHAALLVHSSMDNVDVGAGAGTDDTHTATFNVGNSVGSDGTAGGSANTAPALTTIIPLASGQTGQIGQALSLPGLENAGVRYDGIAAPGTGDYSVSLWYNFNSAAQNGMLASQGNIGSSSEGWSIFHENGELIFRMSVGGGGGDLRAAVHGNVANDALWHHAALVINAAGTIQGFIDGAEVTDIGSGGPPDGTFVSDGDGLANADPILLGVRLSGGFQFSGLMDDFQVYDQALTGNDVGAIYNGGLTGVSLTVPEPSSTALLGLGGLALIFRRRK